MCGIAGLYRREGRIDLGRLAHLGRILRHRGPHDEGMVILEPGTGRSRAGAWIPRTPWPSAW